MLKNLLSLEDYSWASFVDSCITEFGINAIDDRTNGEPGHVLLVNVKSGDCHYVIIWYVARIVNAYCFRVQSIGADLSTVFPDFNNKTPKKWNASPIDTQVFVNKLMELTTSFYPGIQLFDQDLDRVIAFLSTEVHDIGEATVLNAFFSNYSY